MKKIDGIMLPVLAKSLQSKYRNIEQHDRIFNSYYVSRNVSVKQYRSTQHIQQVKNAYEHTWNGYWNLSSRAATLSPDNETLRRKI